MRSFQKCNSIEERVFMEHELIKICQRCRERGILFTRDWAAVTEPCLARESPIAYNSINQMIRDSDQGVVQRVQQVVIDQAQQQQKFQSKQKEVDPSEGNQHNQRQAGLRDDHQGDQDHHPQDNQYSFSFSFGDQNAAKSQAHPKLAQSHSVKSSGQKQEPNKEDQEWAASSLFREQKQKDNRLLQKMNSSTGDDKRSSPVRKQMLLPGGFDSSGGKKNEQREESTPKALDQKQTTVKGTCQVLEKAYFRLTSAPDPAEVRPEEVLQQSLKLMNKKWKKRQADYRYIDEQFRSMRQDLTVQRIQNALAVKIYETHARIALEMADLDQFNQC